MLKTAHSGQFLFGMLVAHIAALAGANGSGSGFVGSIAGATEGSVSVTVNPLAVPGNNAAWFQQTNFGAAYWQATGRYRQAFYIPGQSFPAPRQYPYPGYPWLR